MILSCSIAEMFDFEIFAAESRKFLLCPRRRMPFKVTAQTVVRIVYAVFHDIDQRRMSDTRFKVQTAYFHTAYIFMVAEKPVACSGKYPFVVLRHQHGYVREVR